MENDKVIRVVSEVISVLKLISDFTDLLKSSSHLCHTEDKTDICDDIIRHVSLQYCGHTAEREAGCRLWD